MCLSSSSYNSSCALRKEIQRKEIPEGNQFKLSIFQDLLMVLSYQNLINKLTVYIFKIP